jgi:hypothetical protein
MMMYRDNLFNRIAILILRETKIRVSDGTNKGGWNEILCCR